MELLVRIRHGQTVDRKTGRISGPDAALDRKGIKQAQRMGWLLRKEEFDVIYSGQYPRQVITAGYVAQYHTGLEIQEWDQFNERNFGNFEGRILKTDEAEAFRKCKYCLDWRPGGNGETMSELYDRVFDALDVIAGSHAKERVLIVTSAGPARIIDAVMNHIPLDMVMNLRRPSNYDIKKYTTKGNLAYLGRDTIYTFDPREN